ncbi:hypothetical protein KFL_002570180 [Klebsormidium nitens]|uniref:Uncharacterized protein n=1 Tax=Klebsormidium nitens TaxID=105231 RepID=A0A1Y1I4I5_KLENI|nr:hypothetical protein KFL_002570180 [Klebsormidium nitens]|eukprot:GAQ85850.1 hypothetical protein KFL_002570180 [Klebsormidium nitens]
MKSGGKVEMVSAFYSLFHGKQLLTLIALVMFATLSLIVTASVSSQGLRTTLLGYGDFAGGLLASDEADRTAQDGAEHLNHSFALRFNGTEAMRPMQELGDSIIPALYASHRYKEMRDKYPGSKFFIRRPIPVVGTPVLNNGHWLKRLVYSIDVPVRMIQIIVGTMPGSKTMDTSVRDALEELNQRLPPGFLSVVDMGCNMGSGGGWNAVFEHNLDAPWYLLVSGDVAFAPGALARIPDELEDPQNEKIFAFMYSQFRFFALRREALDLVGVWDENMWPSYYDDNEYQARMERAQALTPGVQRICYIGEPMPDGRRFDEPAHIHGGSELLGPYADVWLEEGAERISGALRAEPRLAARKGPSGFNSLRFMMNKYNFSYWEMKPKEQLEISWRLPFNNPERGIPRWVLDPMVRAVQMSIWNLDNDMLNAVWERYDFSGMLPGDTRTDPEREWKDTHGNELQMVLPRGIKFNTEAFIAAQGPQCVSGFAAAQGLVSNLLKIQRGGTPE